MQATKNIDIGMKKGTEIIPNLNGEKKHVSLLSKIKATFKKITNKIKTIEEVKMENNNINRKGGRELG